MVLILILGILFRIIAAICNNYMDKLMIAYALLSDKDEEKLNPKWLSFNPMAKWKDGVYGVEKADNVLLLKIGVKTKWLADNCNDGWHALKSAMIVLIEASTILLAYSCATLLPPMWAYVVAFPVLGLMWNGTFNLFYKRTSIKR